MFGRCGLSIACKSFGNLEMVGFRNLKLKIVFFNRGHFFATQPNVGGSEEVINSLFVSALMALGQPTDISQTFGISPQSGQELRRALLYGGKEVFV